MDNFCIVSTMLRRVLGDLPMGELPTPGSREMQHTPRNLTRTAIVEAAHLAEATLAQLCRISSSYLALPLVRYAGAGSTETKPEISSHSE